MKHKEPGSTLVMLDGNVGQVAQESADLGNRFLEDPYPDPLKRLVKALKHKQKLLYPFQNALGVTTPALDLYLKAGRVRYVTDSDLPSGIQLPGTCP